MSFFDKEIDTKTIGGMLIEKLITCICAGVVFIIGWQFYTAYNLETKLDNHIKATTAAFVKEAADRALDFANDTNEKVKREADLLKRISALEESRKSSIPTAVPVLPTGPVGSGIPNLTVPKLHLPDLTPNPQQTPLEYERMYRKEFKK